MNNKLTLGPKTSSALLGIEVPSYIVAEGIRFNWREDQGCFRYYDGFQLMDLYVEPDDNYGTISEDSFYEIDR